MEQIVPILYETHMHTPLCKHAVGEPEEYAAAAKARGLKGITVTCHNPLPDGHSLWIRMSPEEFPQYLALIERARKACEGSIDVRLGLECDYFPGIEPWLKEQTRWAPFDYLIGSVHPHTAEYRQTYYKDDPWEFQKLYFEHLAMSAETGLFDCVAHPDLIKNSFPHHWKLSRSMPEIIKALDRIARTGCAMELNTSGVNKEISEMNPGEKFLKEMRARGIPVVVGSDAHTPTRVADGWENAYDMLEKAGYDAVSFFLERKRRDIPIAQARASLKKS